MCWACIWNCMYRMELGSWGPFPQALVPSWCFISGWEDTLNWELWVVQGGSTRGECQGKYALCGQTVPVKKFLSKLEKDSSALWPSHPHYSRREWNSPSLNKSLRIQKDFSFSLQDPVMLSHSLREYSQKYSGIESSYHPTYLLLPGISSTDTAFTSLLGQLLISIPSYSYWVSDPSPSHPLSSLLWVVWSAESHLFSLTSNFSRQPLSSSNSSQMKWRRGHVGSCW